MALQTSYLTSPTKARPFRLPSPTLSAWDWQRRGRCRGVSSEVFFPEENRGDLRRRREAQAKLICRDCPVLAACREHALRTPENHGVWGATSASERARMHGEVADRL
ncbi:MAG TPA: WhiB family transcriptional regulator [Mycobacterium sp.]|nr:WhiB family transcriptional regulator [Mycobacterium sp.]